jgi:RNA polymerase sigma factor (sigma-70 family)
MSRVTAFSPEAGAFLPDAPRDPQAPAAPDTRPVAVDALVVGSPAVAPEDALERLLEEELGEQLESELREQLAEQLAGATSDQSAESPDDLESVQPDEPDDAIVSAVELGPLLVQARSGDRPAFAKLHGRLAPLIAAIAARYRPYLPHGVDVDDLRQEMALRLLDALGEFDTERSDAFLAYLKLDLRRHVSSFLRVEARRSGRNAAQRDRLLSLARAASCDPFAIAPDSASPRLRAALRQLRPGQRAVIAGIYWRDRQTRELASELNVTVQAVTAVRRRAEAKLRAALSAPAKPDAE